MIKRVIFLICVCMNIEASIKDYEAIYFFESDEIDIQGTRKLETSKDGSRQLSFTARNFIVSMFFASYFTIEESTVIPENYTIEVKPKFANRSQEINYLREENIVTSKGRDIWSVALASDKKLFDPLSHQIQLRKNIINGLKSFELSIMDIEDGRSKLYEFNIIGNREVKVGENVYDCIVVERQRKASKRKATYLIAPDLNYMFAKVIIFDGDDEITLSLKKILSLG